MGLVVSIFGNMRLPGYRLVHICGTAVLIFHQTTGLPTGQPPHRKSSRWQKIRYYIPSTAWIPEYSLSLCVYLACSLGGRPQLYPRLCPQARRGCTWRSYRGIHAHSTIRFIRVVTCETESSHWSGLFAPNFIPKILLLNVL